MLLYSTHLSVCFINTHNIVNLLLLGFKLFPIFHSYKRRFVSLVLALRALEIISPVLYMGTLLESILDEFGFTSCRPSGLHTTFGTPKSSSFLSKLGSVILLSVGMGASAPLGRTQFLSPPVQWEAISWKLANFLEVSRRFELGQRSHVIFDG